MHAHTATINFLVLFLRASFQQNYIATQELLTLLAKILYVLNDLYLLNSKLAQMFKKQKLFF